MPKVVSAALETLRELGKGGCANAWVEPGWCFGKGIDVGAGQKMRIRYFRQAADAGSARGMYYMGWCCEMGAGVTADPGIERQWYMRAARKGHIGAQLKCADKAALGARWVKALADIGHTTAQVKLAKGESLTAKRMLAEQVAERATGKELMLAEAVLAQGYQETVASDPSQWTYWADRAAKNGHVRWALEMENYYNPVRWVGRELIFLEGADLPKCVDYLEMAAGSKCANSSIDRGAKSFFRPIVLMCRSRSAQS